MKSELDALLEGDDFEEVETTADEEETEETEELEAEEPEEDTEEEETEETEEDSEEEGSTAEPEASGKDSGETEETWTKAAYLDEKRKRQEYEQEMAQLRAELDALKNPAEDLDYSKPEQVASAIQSRAELIATKKVVNLSRAMVKNQYKDYEVMETVFADAAKSDPSLVNQMLVAENPAEFAYKTGKKLSLMKEMGDDPDAYIAMKVAEAVAANKSKEPEPEKPKPKKKPSLAKTPSVSGSTASGESLSDILGR